MYEEIWNHGFPQEFQHFVDCVQNDRVPMITGKDGRAVRSSSSPTESAGSGKKVLLPSKNTADKPWDLLEKGRCETP